MIYLNAENVPIHSISFFVSPSWPARFTLATNLGDMVRPLTCGASLPPGGAESLSVVRGVSLCVCIPRTIPTSLLLVRGGYRFAFLYVEIAVIESPSPPRSFCDHLPDSLPAMSVIASLRVISRRARISCWISVSARPKMSWSLTISSV